MNKKLKHRFKKLQIHCRLNSLSKYESENKGKKSILLIIYRMLVFLLKDCRIVYEGKARHPQPKSLAKFLTTFNKKF